MNSRASLRREKRAILGAWYCSLRICLLRRNASDAPSTEGRLSWCSLPVPKQPVGDAEESFDFRRSLGRGGTWQSARFRTLRFSFRYGFYASMPASPRRQLAPAGLLVKADSEGSLADNFMRKKSISGMYPTQACIA
jgi:hypothetical protein